MKVFQFILLAWIAVVYAKSSGSRIVGGCPTSIQKYPYMTNMQYHYLNIVWMHSCGGVLVTTKTILSAAHCYEHDHPSQWKARIGSSYVSSGDVYRVHDFILHPSYSKLSLYDNDFAIVRLKTNAVLSDYVKTAHIAGYNYNPPDGTEVTAVGWGRLMYDGVHSEKLQHVNVEIINQQTCAERYAYLKTLPEYENWPDVTPGMLCAGIPHVGGKDACQGDSGGPLVYTEDPTVGHVVIGITSWGYKCADYYYPGVYARVSTAADWIVENGSY